MPARLASDRDPPRSCTTRSPSRSRATGTAPRCGSTIPFAKKQEIGLKQVGLELIVTAGGQRRTIMLPPTLAAYKPVSATYVDGTLEVAFSRGE